jgi:hypothetical protein
MFSTRLVLKAHSAWRALFFFFFGNWHFCLITGTIHRDHSSKKKEGWERGVLEYLIQTFTLSIDVVSRISKGSFMSAGISDEII